MNQPVSEDRRQSPLFQRFNGVMFGFFAQIASFRAAREQWTQLRAQMSRFVSEIHLDAVIPVQVVDFANRRNDLFHAVLGLGDRTGGLHHQRQPAAGDLLAGFERQAHPAIERLTGLIGLVRELPNWSDPPKEASPWRITLAH
jgi:hypothetical protein